MMMKNMIFQNTNWVPLIMKIMMKVKIQLSQLNHHLILQHKLRQLFHHLFLHYLKFSQKHQLIFCQYHQLRRNKRNFNLWLLQFFWVLKYLLVYHQFLYQGNHYQWQLTTSILDLRLLFRSIGMSYFVGLIHIRSLQISVLRWIKLYMFFGGEQVSRLLWIVTSLKFYSCVTYIF